MVTELKALYELRRTATMRNQTLYSFALTKRQALDLAKELEASVGGTVMYGQSAVSIYKELCSGTLKIWGVPVRVVES